MTQQQRHEQLQWLLFGCNLRFAGWCGHYHNSPSMIVSLCCRRCSCSFARSIEALCTEGRLSCPVCDSEGSL